MTKKKTFCAECRNDVFYIEKDIEMDAELKDTIYHYDGKAAYCSDCGAEIYIPSFNDYNLESLYDKYRENEGIISLDKIVAIPKKYAIGKRPLSILLGWGEQTFSRYCDGDLPSKQYSAILERIYSDPNYYKQLLGENERKIKAPAYTKSLQALDTLCKANGTDR